MITIGRNVLSDANAATDLEWLVTNGTGSYAYGTVSGALTRRYHGLLVAALQPPAGRTNLVSKIDEAVTYNNTRYDLSSNQFGDGSTPPGGTTYLDRFEFTDNTAIWTYSIGDAQLIKRVWMAYGEDTTYVSYVARNASLPMELDLRVLVNYKDFHANTHANGWQMNISTVEDGVRVDAFDGAVPFYLLSPDADLQPMHDWYYNYHLRAEAYRGLDANGDHLLAASTHVTLEPGATVLMCHSTNENVSLDGDAAWGAHRERQYELLQKADLPENTTAWVQQLVLAADQFIVKRRAGDNPDGRSIIAGYPWFGDWGRDTMIALPGLTLATKRYDEAALILRTFAEYVDQGMLPNRFPDKGETPEYNTVDATLWYVEAIRATYAATEEKQLVQDLYPVLKAIVEWHQRGTRYNIHVDPADGLLYSGEASVQLTWMDAKVGDWVVTPRTGKPVEINALWYNVLRSLAGFAELLGKKADVTTFTEMADKVQASFGRYWNSAGYSYADQREYGYLYDVLNTPDGTADDALRPNQIFAVSLHHSPLTADQQRSVVDECAHYLFTPHGLRSLEKGNDAYVGVYGGDTLSRDGAYHQGTVWGWLVGPFVQAHLRVYDDKARALDYLRSVEHHLSQQCVGTIAEIFDGDAPHLPRGCVAQAWSVAEVLRAWRLVAE